MNFEKHEWQYYYQEHKKIWKIKVILSCNFIGPPKCPKLSELKSIVPANIWKASNLDENLIPMIGTTIDFKCPEHLKLSSG